MQCRLITNTTHYGITTIGFAAQYIVRGQYLVTWLHQYEPYLISLGRYFIRISPSCVGDMKNISWKLKLENTGEVGWKLISHTPRNLGIHKLDEIGNIGIRGFTTWKQKVSATKCYLQWWLNWRTLPVSSDALIFQLNWHLLVSLRLTSHSLLILTKSSSVYKQKTV